MDRQMKIRVDRNSLKQKFLLIIYHILKSEQLPPVITVHVVLPPIIEQAYH
jgi:hypothetical protein